MFMVNLNPELLLHISVVMLLLFVSFLSSYHEKAAVALHFGRVALA